MLYLKIRTPVYEIINNNNEKCFIIYLKIGG